MSHNYTISIKTPSSNGATGIEIPASDAEEFRFPENMTPKAFLAKLDKVVIGQGDAKRKAVACLMVHILKSLHKTKGWNQIGEGVRLKNNILLIGPTGCGKTLIMETLSELSGIPFIKIDATKITPSGYKGQEITEIVQPQLQEIVKKYGANVAKHAIVFVDEIDKLAAIGSEGEFYGRTQASLLTMIEGYDFSVSSGRSSGAKVNSRDMLFVFAGNFESIRRSRAKVTHTIGFSEGSNKVVPPPQDITEEIIKFGIIGELVGRMTSVAELNELSRDDYKKVLLESSASPYVAYKEYMKLIGADADLTESAIDDILDKAMKKKTGLRSLNCLVAEAFEKVILETDYSKIVVKTFPEEPSDWVAGGGEEDDE